MVASTNLMARFLIDMDGGGITMHATLLGTNFNAWHCPKYLCMPAVFLRSHALIRGVR